MSKSNQDEPITNNPLLPFLRMPSKKSALPPTPIALSPTSLETLAVGQDVRAPKFDIKMEEKEEEEDTVKPFWRHCCPNCRILYMKEGEIRLLGIHVNPP